MQDARGSEQANAQGLREREIYSIRKHATVMHDQVLLDLGGAPRTRDQDLQLSTLLSQR
jgi:hypothetical protein